MPNALLSRLRVKWLCFLALLLPVSLPAVAQAPAGMAYVSDGNTASMVTRQEIPACDHWEVWLFKTGAYLPTYGAVRNSLAHWGTIEGPSEQSVEQKLKRGQAFDKVWAKSMGAAYDPAKDFNDENPLGPICVTTTPNATAQANRERADQMSSMLQTLQDAALAAWDAQPEPNEELREYLKTLDAIQQTQARIFQMLDKHVINLAMLDSEMRQMSRQVTNAQQMSNRFQSASSTAAPPASQPAAGMKWAPQQHFAGGIVTVDQSWTMDPDGQGFSITSTTAKGYPFYNTQKVQMDLRIENIKQVASLDGGNATRGWGFFYVNLESPLASTNTEFSNEVELYFSTQAEAFAAFNYFSHLARH